MVLVRVSRNVARERLRAVPELRAGMYVMGEPVMKGVRVSGRRMWRVLAAREAAVAIKVHACRRQQQRVGKAEGEAQTRGS